MAVDSDDGDRSLLFEGASQFWLAPLTGLGQIMFQQNAVTGLLFLIGIAIGSPLMAIGGLMAVIVGTMTARIMRFDEGEIDAGLYGFNAALVGVAMYFHHAVGVTTTIVLLVAAALSTLLTRVMRKGVPFPTYTAPFIITTWLALSVTKSMGIPRLVLPPPPETLSSASAALEGLSEVMFQSNNLTGVLFLVGILISSWRGALWAMVGSMLGGILAYWHNDSIGSISIGIYGYNAALAAMALNLYRRSMILPILAAFVSVPITELFPNTGLVTLTAPFVLASWIVIAIDKLEHKFIQSAT